MALDATKDSALAALERSVVRAGQRWKHFKTNNTYDVITTGIIEASLEPAVVYAGKDGVVWVRPLSIFLGRVKHGETLVPRFTLLQG